MTATGTTQKSRVPRATIHKQILEAAGSQPDATMVELADEVSGATVELVERVLDEYGDPGEEPETVSRPDSEADKTVATSDPATGNQDAGATVVPDAPSEHEQSAQKATDNFGRREREDVVGEQREEPTQQRNDDPAEQRHDDLTEKQRETLRLIYEHPTASQREIAAMLDVTHTTVYHRLRTVDGFEWESRWEFARTLFEDADQDRRGTVEQIVDRIEQVAPEVANGQSGSRVFADPQLTGKIIHACIDAETITEEEVKLIVDDFLVRTAAHQE